MEQDIWEEMSMAGKVVIKVMEGPHTFLGRRPRYYNVVIEKPRSTRSVRATKVNVTRLPDGRYRFDYSYVSGISMGMTNRGTSSARMYIRTGGDVADEIEWYDVDGNRVERWAWMDWRR